MNKFSDAMAPSRVLVLLLMLYSTLFVQLASFVSYGVCMFYGLQIGASLHKCGFV